MMQKRVAVVRGDNLGDMVVTAPLLQALKQQTKAEIHVICRPYVFDILACVPWVDAIHNIDEMSVDHIRSLKLDVAIFAVQNFNLAPEILSRFVEAGVPVRVGQKHKQYVPYLTHPIRRVLFNLYEPEIQRNFALGQPFGLSVPTRARIGMMHRQSINPPDQPCVVDGDYVVLHMFSNKHGREWPTSHFIELIDKISASSNVKIVLTGSAAEQECVETEYPSLLKHSQVINGYARFNMRQLIGVLKNARAVVCAGTGPLHLAAALGTPTIGLFPRYRGCDSRRWGAVGPRVINIQGRGGCQRRPFEYHLRERDCNKIGDTCQCMVNIHVDRVWLELQPYI